MLLRAEKIVSHGTDILANVSEEEMFQIVTNELARKILDDYISKGLIKFEIVNGIHDDFDVITRVRGSLRAYHPDM